MLVYIVSLVLIAVLFVRWKFSYWSRRGLYQFEPSFPFGNVGNEILGKDSFNAFFSRKYSELKALKHKHGGIYVFLEATYIPVDLSLIKRIMIKDFAYFQGHGNFSHPNDPLSLHLFNLEGEQWRLLRTKLTPTFTSGKMKMMFETLLEKADGFEKVVGRCVDNQEALDIKELGARFTTDIIASIAFGIESNTLENGDNDFRKYGKKMFKPNALRLLITQFSPGWLLGPLGVKSIPNDITDFFSNTVRETIRFRESADILRKDFMHLLLQIKNNPGNEKESQITEAEIIAQCFVFFLAGFETSSTTMSFALLELASNPDIQNRLRDEITSVLARHDGKITYESIMEMKYLDMVINETLRKYPPVALIPRVCTKDYPVPGTDVVIEKGTAVKISVWGIHKDPEYYPNPEKFNPDNFTPENVANRPDMTFFPFGEGPRICIGMRFGMLQTRMGLAALLRNFNFTINKKTHFPIELEKVSFILSVEGDIWLDATRI